MFLYLRVVPQQELKYIKTVFIGWLHPPHCQKVKSPSCLCFVEGNLVPSHRLYAVPKCFLTYTDKQSSEPVPTMNQTAGEPGGDWLPLQPPQVSASSLTAFLPVPQGDEPPDGSRRRARSRPAFPTPFHCADVSPDSYQNNPAPSCCVLIDPRRFKGTVINGRGSEEEAGPRSSSTPGHEYKEGAILHRWGVSSASLWLSLLIQLGHCVQQCNVRASTGGWRGVILCSCLNTPVCLIISAFL